jgi:sortase A
MATNRDRRSLGIALLWLGIALLATWSWVTLDGLAFQRSLARRLDELRISTRLRPLVANARASRDEAGESGLIGRIEIPRLGLSAMVLEGTSGRALRRGVGHVERTAFPGERGNVGLAGHRDTHFRGLKEVEKGDLIRIDTPDGVFAYQVESIRIVEPDRADLLDQSGRPRLTLVTCYPFYYVGPAPRRYVVVARPAGPGVTARAPGTTQQIHAREKSKNASAARDPVDARLGA